MPLPKPSWKLTKHAETRIAQRGVSAAALGIFERYADMERKTRGHASAVRLSRRAAIVALGDGFALKDVTKAQRMQVIRAEDVFVTVYRVDAPKARHFKLRNAA